MNIAAILFLIFMGVSLIGGYIAYHMAFYHPHQKKMERPSLPDPHYDPYRQEMRRLYNELIEQSCETVSIRSFDKLTLNGRYYHVQDGAPLAIGFHGYKSSPFIDFAGGAELCFDMGHNLLLVDQRAHGKSDGRTICMGLKERFDVIFWVRYALKRFGEDTPILLYGVSMGASSVLMASGLKLPENVKAIVADCPYASPMDILLKVAQDRGLPVWLCRPMLMLAGSFYGGFALKEETAADAVKRSKVPILILHGEADSYVPCEMSAQIHQANPEKVQRVTFPGAEHGISYLVDTPRYRKTVTDFLKKVL